MFPEVVIVKVVKKKVDTVWVCEGVSGDVFAQGAG